MIKLRFNGHQHRVLCALASLPVLAILSCSEIKDDTIASENRFSIIPGEYSGINFINQVDYTEDFNPYIYRNFYNGGGVGIGDINNDNLPDLYFAGNLVPNKLYLNKGNFRFEDVTGKAGVASEGVWSTGISMVDINADGWLDIYVCKSGNPAGENRHNELFINNGDLTFTESSITYGLSDKGLSTHAAFFDYDRDGDLDCYLLNNSFRPVGRYDIVEDQRAIRDTLGGNKLYRNEMISKKLPPGNYFTDVSAEAGIYGSNIGFGLGVTIGDVNRDGWQDIFVSNDFFERDYLYINNGDGSFTESLQQFIPEISLGSMGADMSDINNDGFPEIFVTEMLPEDEGRLKTTTQFESWDKYHLNFTNGYHRQFPRNVLQLNNGDNSFSEIGRLAGVHATDWSWGALIADLNNDGLKDIFVANGIYKDLLDQDYINFMADPQNIRQMVKDGENVITKLVDMIPTNPIPNYAFENQGGLKFKNRSEEWGLSQPSHSNGSAYGDLDNDGDLDLVTNNVNMPSFVFRNNTREKHEDGSNYLTIKLKGTGYNLSAIGAQVSLWTGGVNHFQELIPFRGFQSTVDTKMTFGLGANKKVDSLIVIWPDYGHTVLKDISVNQVLTIDQEEVDADKRSSREDRSENTIFDVVTVVGLGVTHEESMFVDFDRDRLLFYMISNEGPCLCTGDINGDRLDDIYFGGAKDKSARLLLQTDHGSFVSIESETLSEDRQSEDTDCVFFDADNDGDQDLYVTTGSSEHSSSSSAYIDKLYFNDGSGKLTRSDQILPSFRFESTSTVEVSDYDQDGDNDLFVGTRTIPGSYGVPVNGYLLENDGSGTFSDVTERNAPELLRKGMIKDAFWADTDQDGDEDLLLVGEWMGITYFKNENGSLIDNSASAGLDSTNGLWNRILMTDLNKDGYPDFIVGNLGENSRLKASKDNPARMFVNDFDRNSSIEQIITVFNQDDSYPLVQRNDLVMQLPSLKKKYLKYESYKEQTVQHIFSSEVLSGSITSEIYNTSTSILINNGSGSFTIRKLPLEAQFSTIYGIAADDFDGDGNIDLVMGGNQFRAKPEFGINAASYGHFLKGDGSFNFEVVPSSGSGLKVNGEIRRMEIIQIRGEKHLVIARNNDSMLIYKY